MRQPPPEQFALALSKEHQEAFDRVVTYLSPHRCEGWVEYWFWDVVHGRRPWPFWLDPSEEITADLHVLLEDAKVWFAWSFTRQVWGVVRLSVWQEHTKKNGVVEAQDMCTDFQHKLARARAKKEEQPPVVVVKEEKKGA